VLNQDSTPSKGAANYLYSSGGGYYNQSLPQTSKYEGLQARFMQRLEHPISSMLDQTVARKPPTLANFNSYDGTLHNNSITYPETGTLDVSRGPPGHYSRGESLTGSAYGGG